MTTALILGIVAVLLIWVGLKMPKPVDPNALKLNDRLVCPHCLVTGKVLAGRETRKIGLDSNKMTAALLTGGVSLAVTGASRDEVRAKMQCLNCTTVWYGEWASVN